MPTVGERGWILVGHDSRHHVRAPELWAIRDYDMGCFYLWGAEARIWDKMICFAKAYDKIVRAVASTARPFVYRVHKDGQLNPVRLA